MPLAAQAEPLEVKVGVLRIGHSRETVSILDIPAADDFIAGASMAMADNNTTGKFLDQSFTVDDVKLAADDDAAAAARALLDKGVRYLIVDLPAGALLKVADAAKDENALVFNAGAPDDSLREEDCRANVIHTAPIALDAGRRSGAISDLETMATMVPRRRLPSRGRSARRGL